MGIYSSGGTHSPARALWAPCLPLASHTSLLLTQTLGASGNGLRPWVPAIHVGTPEELLAQPWLLWAFGVWPVMEALSVIQINAFSPSQEDTTIQETLDPGADLQCGHGSDTGEHGVAVALTHASPHLALGDPAEGQQGARRAEPAQCRGEGVSSAGA